jgi:hypothetical protein
MTVYKQLRIKKTKAEETETQNHIRTEISLINQNNIHSNIRKLINAEAASLYAGHDSAAR